MNAPSPAMCEHELGPSIGTYQGRDIPAYIVDDGIRMVFDRIAIEDMHGAVWLSQLARDEFVIAPGLIYRPELPK